MSVPEALASPPLSTPWVPLWPLSSAGVHVTKRVPIEPAGAGQATFYTGLGWTDSLDTTVFFVFAVPNDYAGGDITLYVTVRGAATGLVDWRTSTFRFRVGSPLVQMTTNFDDSHIPGTTNSLRRPIVFLEGSFQAGDVLRGDFRRNGLDPSDTMVGTYAFDGAYIEYRGLLATAPGASAPGYGTSFPASPVDGQEHILVDSLSNSTYQWRFRYNAFSTSAYKWEFVGGTPLTAYVQTQEGASLATYGDLATVGPTVTTPRAGDYQIEFGAMFVQNGASGVHGYASVAIGAAAAADGDAAGYASMGNGVLAGGTARQLVKTGLAAATALKMQYRGSAAVPWLFRERRISILPVRVS